MWARGHIFINWSIYNFILCLFLFFQKASYLIRCQCIINIELMPIALQLMPEKSFPDTCIFSVRHSLPVLGRTRQPCVWGAVLNSEITNRKQEIVKRMALNRLKRILVSSVRAELRRQSRTLFILSWERVHQWLKFFDSLCRLFARLPNCHLIDFAVPNIDM